MQKIIREVDQKRGILQVTTSDERWYLRATRDKATDMPIYLPVPSVTWIAGHWPKGIGFYKWLAEHGWDEAQAIKEAAGDKGSVVHAAIEMILNGEEFRIDTKVPDKNHSNEQHAAERDLTFEELLAVKSFIDWRIDMQQDYKLESIVMETNIFSEKHNFAGTVDWVVRLTPKSEGKNPLKLGEPTLYVIDFKTSKQVWFEYHMQVSAYRVALENGENPLYETNPNGTQGKQLNTSNLRTAILQVGYAGNKDGYKFTEVENAFESFKIAQHIWKIENTSKKTGSMLTPGFKQVDFPLVLSEGKKLAADETASNVEVALAIQATAEVESEEEELEMQEKVIVTPEATSKRTKKQNNAANESAQ